MSVDPLRPAAVPPEFWTSPLPSKRARSPRDRQEAAEAARELEALFLAELLKSLEATLPSGSLLGPGGHPIRGGLMRDELARFLARQGGIGLAEMILESLSPSGSPRPGAGEERTAPSENQ